MKFILINWVKYYTKEVAKTLKLITISLAIVITVVYIKYKPVYKVTISGETIGFIENRKVMEAKIDKYIKNTTGNVAFREIDELPEYEFKFVNKDTQVNEKDVMLSIESLTTTTYRFYAVMLNGEQKALLESKEEAENMINEIKSDMSAEIEFNLCIIDNYTKEHNVVSIDAAKNTLSELKVAKVTEYQSKKAEEEAAARKASLARARTSRARSLATTVTDGPSGDINGIALSIPVTGSISSRFGSRGSSRSTIHTGLDIASSSGNGIRSVASGTVVYAGYKGSYGNLIIIDHGNGVQSYYAHCSAIYVAQGAPVDTNTTIGAVGSTGNSTGPHLHLELRVNGAPVNPQNYLYK